VTYNGVAAAPTNAGTYAVLASFTSADNNYGNASGSGSILINKASSTTTVSGTFTFTFDGNSHSATVAVTGAGGLNLTPDPVYSCGHAPINVADSGCTASYSYAGDANHNPSSDSKAYTINKATPLVSVSGGPFTFDGSAHAATITVTGVGGTAVSGSSAVTYNGVAAAPTNAGTYAVLASFTSADNNYGNASGSGSILINKASSTTTVSGTFTFTFDGNSHSATVAVTGAGGLNLTPDPVYSCGHAPINVADSGCTASYSYAGDANHNPSSDSKTYTINKATPIVSVSGGPFTFDGSAHAATITVTGVGGTSVSGSSAVTYNGVAAAPTNAGTYAVLVSFTSADGNYDNASGSGSILINKANSTTTVSGTFTFTFDGNPHSATVAVTGAGGLSLTPDPVYSCGHAPINVADSGCTASYNFAGDDNHNPSSDSKIYTIGKATPLVTVSGGPFTFDGSAHAATITVTGVGGVVVSGNSAITYNGIATVPTNSGTYAVLVSFTSADNNYDNASGSGSILINKASSTTAVSVAGGVTFTYDAIAHPATVSVTGAGGLSLTPDAVYSCGHAPINVADSGCTASYNFAGDDNHNPSSDSKTYTIGKATPLVTVSGGPFTFDGNSHGAAVGVMGIGGAAVSGTASVIYNGSSILPMHAGAYAVSVTFTSADGNYDNASGSGSITINQAPSITTVSGVFNFTYDGTTHPATVAVTGAGGLNLTPSPIYTCGHVPLNVADSGCIASYTYAGDIDHNGSSDAKTYSISKATPVLAINPLAPVTIGNPTTISGSVKLNLLVPTGSVAITVNGVSQLAAIGAGGAYSTTFAPGTINVGSYTVTAAYFGDGNFNPANNGGTLTLVVQYGICYLYDQSKAVQHNATVPIKLQLCDAAGHNLSSSTITVTATTVALVSGGSGLVEDSGNANPDDNFRYDPTLPGYIFNLSTKPLSSGTWRLSFRTSNDPAGTSPYTAAFGIK
jgi:uncharacterized Zn-binding protein involved in type VI secretion